MSTTKVVEIEYRVKVTGDKIPSAPPVPSPKRDPKNEKESLDYLKALEKAGAVTGGSLGNLAGIMADTSDGAEALGISLGPVGLALGAVTLAVGLTTAAMYGITQAIQASGQAAIEAADSLKLAYDEDKLNAIKDFNYEVQAQEESYKRLSIEVFNFTGGPAKELNSFWTGTYSYLADVLKQMDEFIDKLDKIRGIVHTVAKTAETFGKIEQFAFSPGSFITGQAIGYGVGSVINKGQSVNDELALELEYEDKLAAIKKDRIAHGKEEAANEKELASLAKSRSADAAKALSDQLRLQQEMNNLIAQTFKEQAAANKERDAFTKNYFDNLQTIALETKALTATEYERVKIAHELANLKAQAAIDAETDPEKKKALIDIQNAELEKQKIEENQAYNKEQKTIADAAAEGADAFQEALDAKFKNPGSYITSVSDFFYNQSQAGIDNGINKGIMSGINYLVHFKSSLSGTLESVFGENTMKFGKMMLEAVKKAAVGFSSLVTGISNLGQPILDAERNTKQTAKDYQDIMNDPNATPEDKAAAKKALERSERAEKQASLSAGAGAISTGLTAAGIPIPAEALEIFMHPKKLQKMLEGVLDGLIKAIPKVLEVLPTILIDVGFQILSRLPEILMSIFKGIWEGIKAWFDNIIDLLTFWKKDKDEPRNKMSKNRERKTTIVYPNGTVIRG